MVNRKKMTSAKCRATGINDKIDNILSIKCIERVSILRRENARITNNGKTLAESVEDDDNNFPESEERRTTISGKIVPNNTVRVVIEPLWLDNLLNLNHESIVTSLEEIPIDDDFDLINDNNTNNNENDDEEEEYVVGRDVLDYTANDLIAEFGEFLNIFFFFLILF